MAPTEPTPEYSPLGSELLDLERASGYAEGRREVVAELRTWAEEECEDVRKIIAEDARVPAIMVLKRLGEKFDELHDGPEHLVHPFVEARPARVARVVRMGVIAELRTWHKGRVEGLVNASGEVASGERYALDRLLAKLDELEDSESKPPSISDTLKAAQAALEERPTDFDDGALSTIADYASDLSDIANDLWEERGLRQQGRLKSSPAPQTSSDLRSP